ncbi:hypothetical protein IMG5_200380 [Ichthyophthirius multifiliis]|uniref:Phosphodiesterase n=1 Tax=Ichthyophthirius multifiliis TaxID=5932 RepID=G0R5R3_ICHMU|nr:hypothetical protein IMG5_200380 [Ichthyophthirius multifiliis]EGR27193.1 hypothetical protein IMG5_200380 [Ichthyophthirius multifiliis]|eukprot:XP_004024077.1 hypothetical protein IMG5_200380 [Ichthyophthirius multifiliis]
MRMVYIFRNKNIFIYFINSKILHCNDQLFKEITKQNQWNVIINNGFINIPIGDSKKVQYIIQLEQFKLNIFTFVERLTKYWRYFTGLISNYSMKEFIMQIIELKTPESIFFLFNKKRQLIYQPLPLPSNLEYFFKIIQQLIFLLKNNSFIYIPENHQMGQLLGIDDVIFEEENKKLIKKVINELEKGELNFGNVDAKQYQIGQLNIKYRNLLMQINQFLQKNKYKYKQIKITDDFFKDSYVIEYYHTDLPIKFKSNMQKLLTKFQQSFDRIETTPFNNQISKYSLQQVSPSDQNLLQSWDFPYDKIENIEDKIRYIWCMFDLKGYVKQMNIEKDVFYKFMHQCIKEYDKNNNPFHNFQHALAVSHAIFYFLNQKLLDQYLDTIEQFTLLFSAMGHDVSHTGHTNTFEIATQSKIAIKYNDESVLENHHASSLFKLLYQNNFLVNLTAEETQNMRKFCISNILSTDMKKHKDLTQAFEIKLACASQERIDLIKNEADKKLMCGFVVHVADLTGPTKINDLSKEWSFRICREFTQQVEEEKKLGIPVTPYLLGLDQLEIIAKQESNFSKVIVLPLYNVFIKFVGEEYKFMITNCENNIKEWEKIQIQEKIKNAEQ